MGIARVLFARSHNLGGLWIRAHDNVAPRRWSHAAVCVEVRGSPVVVEARVFRGVVVTPFDEFVARYPKVESIEYEVPDLTTGGAWLERQVGKGYDYLAVLGRICRRSWNEDSRWHCQELVEAYLAACDRQRFRDGPWLITPNVGYMVL